jgi:hypothetical protein
LFVQVIQGKVSDVAAARARFETWVRELGPAAEGWLGSTAGVTDSGDLVAFARFESEAAAQRNSDRPQQTAWWEETATLFSGEPAFLNSTDVDVDVVGDPDTAGFVQVMQGRTSNPGRVRELMAADPTDWASFRPDILGTLTVSHQDGAWTMAIYFTSEEEAREGERKEPPAELAQAMKEMETLAVGEQAFFDLRDPWLYSPS